MLRDGIYYFRNPQPGGIMKVIGVNGSARADGNTTIIMRMVLAELEADGIETELIQLAEKEIIPCRGCFACKGQPNCVIAGDDFTAIFAAICHADGLLLGSPVYSADVSAKMKAFLERAAVIVAGSPGLLRYKVAAGVTAVRRGGGLSAVDTLNHFFLNKEMIVAGSTYWNMVYGRNIGEVNDDTEGVNNMRNLGRNMAWLLRKLG